MNSYSDITDERLTVLYITIANDFYSVCVSPFVNILVPFECPKFCL